MSDLTFSVGEYGFNLTITLQNADGSAFDLTGYAVTFSMKNAVTGTNKFSSAASIVGSATAGVVNYLVQSTDFDTIAPYFASCIATKTGVRREFKQFTISIQASSL